MKFQTSPENQALIDKMAATLQACPTGSTISYADITPDGEPIQPRRWLLSAAVKAAESATGSRFATVRNVGVKRLRPDDLPGIGSEYIGRVRRTAMRGVARLETRDNLPPDTLRKVTAQKAQLGAVALFTKPHATEKVEGTIKADQSTVDLAATVRLLGGV